MSIDLLDLLILLALLIGLLNGHQRGFWLSVIQYAGLLAGVLLGATIAPLVTELLGISRIYRPLAAVLVLVVTTSLVSSIGHWMADPIRMRSQWRSGSRPQHGALGEAGRMGGAAFSAVAVLCVVWFVGLTFARGPNAEVAKLVQGSAIERRLDALAPRPPGFLTKVQGLLSDVPQTFADLEPGLLPGALQITPGSADTTGVRAAAASTVKITGRGCGGIVTGSGFPIAQELVVTNAHVVAGTSSTTVQLPGEGRKPMPAVVVLFDRGRDLALLRVAGLPLAPLVMAEGGRGTQGAIIGYPNGGGERAVPAVVDGSWSARGRDIYNQELVQREIFIVEGQVEPGNSGGPLVDRAGHALGVVFAASTTRSGQAYALTDHELSASLAQLAPQGVQIDTRQVPCAI